MHPRHDIIHRSPQFRLYYKAGLVRVSTVAWHLFTRTDVLFSRPDGQADQLYFTLCSTSKT